jgi:hypothetical protein
MQVEATNDVSQAFNHHPEIFHDTPRSAYSDAKHIPRHSSSINAQAFLDAAATNNHDIPNVPLSRMTVEL